MKKERLAAVALPLLLLTAAPHGHAADEEFCYGPSDGGCLPPDQWPGICVEGNESRQSPIDISKTGRADLPTLIHDYEKEEDISVLTNGHTLEVELVDTNDVLIVGDRTCELLQFHFHTTSEHLFGGTSFPIEAHLVHQCGPNDLIVVGVMMSYLKNEANRALQAALDHAATKDGKFVKGTNEVEGVHFSAADLLPQGARSTNYFNYSGSLTTPACTEIVDWYVLKNPVWVSRAQVAALKRVLEDTSPNGFPFNNRPVQSVAGREIDRKGRLEHR